MMIEKYEDLAAFRARLKILMRTKFTVTMEINAEMAQEMLRYNTGNRPISERRVALYAREMSAGNWALTGEALIYSSDGTLNNGQHRLLAAIEAEKPFITDVRFGIARDAYKFTDLGAKRTQADALSIVGEKHCTTLAAALAWIHRFQRGLPESARDKCDIPTTLKLLEQHPDIRESVNKARWAIAVFPGFQMGPMSFVHYAASQRSLGEADQFFEGIRSGFGITAATDPIYRLRQRMTQTLMSRVELRATDQIALSFKAWNAYREKQPVRQLSWRADGPQAEAFPEPV